MSNMLLNTKVLQILEEFSSDYRKRIYGRNIAKRLKMNQKTVSNILNKLEKENILKFSYEGKNKYYYLNMFNSIIKEVIKLAEIDRKIRFIARNKNLKEFEKVSKELTEKELNQTKEQLIGNYQISMEDSQTQTINLLVSEIQGDAKDFYEYEKNISKVKLKDVKELAKKTIKEYSFFALVPGNKK